MKSVTILILTISITISALAAETAGNLTNFSLALSPFYPASVSSEIEYQVKKFALDAPKGSKIRLDDAYHLRSIVDLSPPDLRYDSPANRMRLLAPTFAKLSQWFAQTRTNVAFPELKDSGALKAPQWLDQISAQPEAEARSFVLIGSPLHRSVEEPGFDMIPDLYPSDAHLAAAPEISVFSVVHKQNRLANATLHWAYPSESMWANQLHADRVKRFWTLWVNCQNGTLATFSPDLGAVFLAAPKLFPPTVGNYKLELNDVKVTMRAARPREIPRWLATPATDSATVQHNASARIPANPANTGVPTRAVAIQPAPPAAVPVAVAPVPPPPQPGPPPQAQVPVAPAQAVARPTVPLSPVLDMSAPLPVGVDLGLMWSSTDQHVDVDVYVRARPGSEEIWYQKTHTPDGVLIKDWTQPNSQTDFEWVKLNPGVRLDQVEAWVNLFKGRGPISGRVALHFENRTFLGSFTIPATSGNGGIDAASRQNSSYWTRIDLRQLLTQPQ